MAGVLPRPAQPAPDEMRREGVLAVPGQNFGPTLYGGIQCLRRLKAAGAEMIQDAYGQREA
jgi:hypothetical protein